MTEERARQVANVVMAAAALGAAVLVMKSPRLRRMAWQLAKYYASGPVAGWTAATVRDAWDASASAPSELRRDRSAHETPRELRRSRDVSAVAPSEPPRIAKEVRRLQ